MRHSWVTRGVVALSCVGLGGVLLWFVGSLPRDPLFAGVVAVLLGGAITALWWSSVDLPRPADAASWYAVRREESAVPPSLDYRLVRLRRDLRDALERNDRGDEVHPLLRELTRVRLLQRHTVDLDTEPEQAVALMSPALAKYLASPPKANEKRSMKQLSDALTGIEEL